MYMNKVVSKDGTTIAFDRSGKGPALILVGGAFQHRAGDPQTAQLAVLLSPHFTVYHYDRRGRGDSSDTLPYAVEREIEDLEALIEEAGGKACVFGMSSGAALVLEASLEGLNITRMALYEPPYNNDPNARTGMMSYTKQLNNLLAEGKRGDAAALAMKTFGAPEEAIAGMRRSPGWSYLESIAPTLAYDAAVMGDYAVPSKRLASLSVPALVLDGGASPDWARSAVETLAEVLPHAQRRTLEGQTHNVDPQVLAPVLIEFFAG
jgi:pimeloyl-ACP methyl ester carboxylesterase